MNGRIFLSLPLCVQNSGGVLRLTRPPRLPLQSEGPGSSPWADCLLTDTGPLSSAARVCSVTSDSLQLHGLQPKLFWPWRFPGKSTGVGCHFLLQGTFQTQGLNPRLSHWQLDSLLLSCLGSPELLRASLHWSAKWGVMTGNPLPPPGPYQGRLKSEMNPPLDTRGEKK